MIKVKIQSGRNSIELEGDAPEVEAVLERYWTHAVAYDGGDEQPDDIAIPSKAKQRKSRPKRTKVSQAADQSTKTSAIDAEAVANKIKTHPLFPKIKSKILDVGSEWIVKCRLVALVAGEPITSGDVHRVLNQLRIRNSLATLSKTLGNNSTDFITRGNSPVRHELTAAAQEAFERWLADDA